MTAFAVDPEALKTTIAQALGERVASIHVALGEVTVVVSAANYLDAARILHEAPGCQFELLIDLCGVDYSEYRDNRDGPYGAGRYCVVSHLLSVSLNTSASGSRCLRRMTICPWWRR